MGKVFHQSGLRNDRDELNSWSEKNVRIPRTIYHEGGKAVQAVSEQQRDGRILLDDYTTDAAIQTLRRVAEDWKKKQKNFFVAVGLKKPHLNFIFPDKFLEYYPNVSMPVNPTASKNLPNRAWIRSSEIRGRKEYLDYIRNWSKDTPLPDWIARELRTGYYSCITYIDSLIGEILQELEDLELSKDTIVSFIGDHGFHLGEHNIVGKNTAFEVANNSPMIIRIPGITDNGHVSDKLVEFVDLFPTMAEHATLPTLTTCPSNTCGFDESKVVYRRGKHRPIVHRHEDTEMEGPSVLPVPTLCGVYAQKFCMGYSMRAQQYRYTEWVTYDYVDEKADWSNLCGAELYDHYTDPSETNNIEMK
mgnify:CR=1 FL=1